MHLALEKNEHAADSSESTQMKTSCDKVLKDFHSKTKKLKKITILILVKCLENCSITTIKCPTLDKKGFFPHNYTV